MTSGWSGQAYGGIPAGLVTTASQLWAPPHESVGLGYYQARGLPASMGALEPLYASASALPEACAAAGVQGCGAPPMSFCRGLRCPRLSAPFPEGCRGPGAEAP